MFYSDVILSKRGPLAKVWLAAHAERRLSKSQLIHTDIEQSVATIIGEDGGPMALRLSGQLLLGVARIYSRQAKYLLDDCNEALLRLKTAFRSGALESTDLAPGTRQAVTLPVTRTAYDLSLPDPAFEGWDVASSVGGSEGRNSNRYTARPADITLQRSLHGQLESSPGWASGDFLGLGVNSDAMRSARSLERRDSQGRLVDANGDLIGEEDETFSSIGVGRDAQPQLAGRSSVLGADFSGFEDFGADDFPMPEIGGASISGGLDLGLEQFEAERQRSATPVRGSLSMVNDLTPQSKQRMQQAAERRAAITKGSRKVLRQVVDPHTEMNDGVPGRRSRNTDALVNRNRTFLPSSRAELHLLELEKDPSKGLLPFAKIDGSSQQIYAAALSLAPQLRELFTFDVAALRRQRLPGADDDIGPAQKRLRGVSEDDEEDYSSEIGRRADPSADFDLTFATDDFGGFDNEVGNEVNVPQMDITAEEGDITRQLKDTTALRRSDRIRESDVQRVDEQEQSRQRAFRDLGDLGRLGTPSDGTPVPRSELELSPTSSYPLRAFDTVPPPSTSSSDVDAQFRSAADFAETRTSASLGLSRNAVRAVQVLRKELGPAPAEENQAQRRPSRRGGATGQTTLATMSFQDVTRNASRRAAAGFFFELLALGTKDCIEVEQQESYGDIRVQAKPGLWHMARAARA